MAEIDPTTTEGAVARLAAIRAEEAQEEETTEETEDVEETEEEEQQDLADADEEPESEEDEPEEQEAETDDNRATLDAPDGWTAEARERFAELPEDLQEEIVRRDKDTYRGVQRQLGEVKQQQEALEAQAAEVVKLREQYAERLQAAIAVTDTLKPDRALKNPDSDSYDPDEYERQSFRYEDALERQADRQRELDELNEQRREEAKKAHINELRFNEEKLVEYFPDWTDAKKGKAEIEKIRSYISSDEYQIPETVAAKVYNASMLRIAWKAMQYDSIQAEQGKKSTRKKPPKTVKSTRATRAPNANIADLRKAHAEQHSVESATALLRAQTQQQQRKAR